MPTYLSRDENGEFYNISNGPLKQVGVSWSVKGTAYKMLVFHFEVFEAMFATPRLKPGQQVMLEGKLPVAKGG
jgi:hypothetical protein